MSETSRRIRRGEEEGFTLIELLIVIVILGILSAVVVFAVGGITDRGNDSACKSDRKSVEVASEAYYAQRGTYATAIDGPAGSPTLVGGGFLREAPSTTGGYTINYSAADGAVTSTPADCNV
jgi:prepilin-type N-terminal cleavage/methylation domain-containing protein